MMLKNEYCVYIIAIKTGKKVCLYVGHGDKIEPARRKYDFLREHNLSRRINSNTKKNNYWRATPVVLYKGLTKDQALLIENEIIGVLYKDPRCLNSNRAVKNAEWATPEQIQEARRKTADLIQIALFIRGLEGNPISEFWGLDEDTIQAYKTIAEIAEGWK